MKRTLITAAVAAAMGLTTVGAASAQSYRDGNGYYYDNSRDGCHAKKRSNGTAGAVLGGIAGAVLGSNVAHGGGRTGGAIIGGAAGAAVGNNIGRNGVNCDGRGYYYNRSNGNYNNRSNGYYDSYGRWHANSGYYYNRTDGYYDSYGTWHYNNDGYTPY